MQFPETPGVMPCSRRRGGGGGGGGSGEGGGQMRQREDLLFFLLRVKRKQSGKWSVRAVSRRGAPSAPRLPPSRLTGAQRPGSGRPPAEAPARQPRGAGKRRPPAALGRRGGGEGAGPARGLPRAPLQCAPPFPASPTRAPLGRGAVGTSTEAELGDPAAPGDALARGDARLHRAPRAAGSGLRSGRWGPRERPRRRGDGRSGQCALPEPDEPDEPDEGAPGRGGCGLRSRWRRGHPRRGRLEGPRVRARPGRVLTPRSAAEPGFRRQNRLRLCISGPFFLLFSTLTRNLG